MYKVKCTGKNPNYGEAGEIRLMADTYLSTAVNKGWVEVISYEGSGKPNSLLALRDSLDSIDKNIALLQMKKKFIQHKIKTGAFVKGNEIKWRNVK